MTSTKAISSNRSATTGAGNSTAAKKAAWTTAAAAASHAAGQSTPAGRAALETAIASLKAAIKDPAKLAVMAKTFALDGKNPLTSNADPKYFASLLKQLKTLVMQLDAGQIVVRPPGAKDSLISPDGTKGSPAVLIEPNVTNGAPMIMYDPSLSPKDLRLAIYTELGNYLSDRLIKARVNVSSGAIGTRFALVADSATAFQASGLSSANFRKDFVAGTNKHTDLVKVVYDGKTVTAVDLSGWAIAGIVVGAVILVAAAAAAAIVAAPVIAASFAADAAVAAGVGGEIELSTAIAGSAATEAAVGAAETAAAAGESITAAEQAALVASRAAEGHQAVTHALSAATQNGARAGIVEIEALSGSRTLAGDLASAEAGNVAAGSRVATEVSEAVIRLADEAVAADNAEVASHGLDASNEITAIINRSEQLHSLEGLVAELRTASLAEGQAPAAAWAENAEQHIAAAQHVAYEDLERLSSISSWSSSGELGHIAGRLGTAEYNLYHELDLVADPPSFISEIGGRLPLANVPNLLKQLMARETHGGAVRHQMMVDHNAATTSMQNALASVTAKRAAEHMGNQIYNEALSLTRNTLTIHISMEDPILGHPVELSVTAVALPNLRSKVDTYLKSHPHALVRHFAAGSYLEPGNPLEHNAPSPDPTTT